MPQRYFKGQKAISDKIDARGGNSSSDVPQVYIERKSTTGTQESILLGKVATLFDFGDYGRLNPQGIINPTVNDSDLRYFLADLFWACMSKYSCPQKAFNINIPGGAEEGESVVFVPSGEKMAEYTLADGVKPTLCFVKTANEGTPTQWVNGEMPILKTNIQCSYYPQKCQKTGSNSKNCLIATQLPMRRMYIDYVANPVPQDQRWRIVIK